MNNNYYFYSWFQKIISIFIDIFFLVVPIACLAVFTSVFEGTSRIIVFLVLAIAYLLVVYFCKDKVLSILATIENNLKKVDQYRLLLILVITMIVIKIIYTFFFGYDATTEGDIQIYNDIADNIIATKSLHSDAISHLYGIALHFVIFKLLHIPLHIGVFFAFLIGTIVNYLSFKKIIGKEKTFLLLLIYVLMPSSGFVSFCPTHEIFVYLYMSLFIYVLCLLYETDSYKKYIIYGLLLTLFLVLTLFVNPGGYILYVVIVLLIALSNIEIKKKVTIGIVLVLSILCSNAISKALDINQWNTSMNTYTILIHGSNPYSLGEQVDGYPLKQMRYFIYDNTMDFSREGFLFAARNVLINQYKYLLSHPVTLFKLISNKIYILWSGVHYPMELANHHGVIEGIIYYIFLTINTLIYLFMITLGTISRKKTNDNLSISTYKLVLLGICAVTLLSIVVNKYSLYATAYIYLISFYRIGNIGKHD